MSKASESGRYPSPPQQWSSQQSQQNPYPPAAGPRTQSQPHSAYPAVSSPYSPQPGQPAGDMVTLPPPQSHLQHEMYRPQGSFDMYHPPPQQAGMPYTPTGPHPGTAPPPPASFGQPAPRQRTAIACRYCRRRKIRCHGFDTSPDGRCSNCLRFQQECVFTPVSSQAHAFVPAHTAYPHLRAAGQSAPDDRSGYGPGQPVIYGAHGQPLPRSQQVPHPAEGYGHPPPGYPSHMYPSPGFDEHGPRSAAGQPHSQGAIHPQDSPRIATTPGSGRRSSYEYPDPTQMAPGPASAGAAAPYHPAPYPAQSTQQPYYAGGHASQGPPTTGPGRRSPTSAYSYDARASVSPHGSNSSASGFAPFSANLHPPQAVSGGFDSGRTPPPTTPRELHGGNANAGAAGRSSMSVRDMLGPDGNQGSQRSTADSDMLKSLNRSGMR